MLPVARPVCSIIPPHVLDHLARHGDDDARAAALRNIRTSERLRGRREAFMAMPSAVPAGERRRTVYDAGHGTRLPGKRVRGEGEKAAKDVSVNEAYDGAGATYDFYAKVCERNSVDGRGQRLDSTVHYDHDYDNAFWDGQQMVYGDGDGRYFQRFTICLDVIGHELTHGVTQHTARLEYHDQPGALNESMSDVFGSLVKQHALRQDARKADWLIGEGLFTKKVKGKALRSMAKPGTAYDDPALGKDPQPAHMRNYVKGGDDNGGVHINSGIPNHAFYIVATQLGGPAWERAGRIWYHALTTRLHATTDFRGAAKATLRSAEEVYGQGSAEGKAVRSAWDEVGVSVK